MERMSHEQVTFTSRTSHTRVTTESQMSHEPVYSMEAYSNHLEAMNEPFNKQVTHESKMSLK